MVEVMTELVTRIDFQEWLETQDANVLAAIHFAIKDAQAIGYRNGRLSMKLEAQSVLRERVGKSYEFAAITYLPTDVAIRDEAIECLIAVLRIQT